MPECWLRVVLDLGWNAPALFPGGDKNKGCCGLPAASAMDPGLSQGFVSRLVMRPEKSCNRVSKPIRLRSIMLFGTSLLSPAQDDSTASLGFPDCFWSRAGPPVYCLRHDDDEEEEDEDDNDDDDDDEEEEEEDDEDDEEEEEDEDDDDDDDDEDDDDDVAVVDVQHWGILPAFCLGRS